MRSESKKLLVDIQQALAHIRNFTATMELPDYRANEMSRAAVERKFEIIGEACARLRDRYPDDFGCISAAPQIIGFRNRLIHGYDGVDDGIVWDVIHRKLPLLEREIAELLK